jgi:hypothetical protein
MMMSQRRVTLELEDLVKSMPAFQKLTQAAPEKIAPLVLRLSRVRRKVTPELEALNDYQLALAKHHGTRVPGTDQYKFETDVARDAFQEEYKARCQETFEFSVPDIKFSEIESLGLLNADDIVDLEWLFSDVDLASDEEGAGEGVRQDAAQTKTA